MIKKSFKILMIIFLFLGVGFSISNFFPKKIDAHGGYNATMMSNGECVGEPINCFVSISNGGSGSSIYPTSIELEKKKQVKPKESKTETGINPPKKIEFSSKSELPKEARSFCVTEDELLLIPDIEIGNIKIYEIKKYDKNKKIELTQIIGKKGYGKNEFLKPSFCFYNKKVSRFGIMDMGKRKISIYNRMGKKRFQHFQDIFCPRAGGDFQLSGNDLFISGYEVDKKGKGYDLYYIDIKKNSKKVLLPSYYKYGKESEKEYNNEYRNKGNIPLIGVTGFFDIQGDDIFFTWEGNLNVIKINIKEKIFTPFGKKTPYYKKPTPTETLRRAYNEPNFDRVLEEKATMSYIRNIFTSKDYVLVIYEGPNKPKNKSNFRMQFYTLEGDFLNEMPIPGNPDKRMWFDKDKQVLYSLYGTSEKSPEYHILKYQINFSIKKG